MKIRLFGVAAASLLVVSCRITAPPDPGGGLGPIATVYSAVVSEEIGQLFAQDDGLWAFRTPEPARAESYKPGAVVAFGDAQEPSRNLFGVVETATWGVRLQRLDADPLSGRASGALIPLSQLDAQTGSRWGFCAGSGDPAASECIARAPNGTRWWLYELQADGSLAVDPEKDINATLPIALRGLVGTSALGTDVLGVELPTRWLAVPSIYTRARPTRPRIVVDTGCDVGSPHREALDAQWVRAKVNPPVGPLTTSSESIRLGADAIVWCSGQSARVAVPTLYRPAIDVIGRGFALPPMLGSSIITIPASATAVTDWVARLGAAISTGDFASADYLSEAAARRHGKLRALDRVLVDSMTAVAEGGRAEAATRLGRWSTRLQWNAENSAAWQIGMSNIEVSLGNRKAAITRTATLTDVLNRGDDARRAWVAYFWAVTQIRARGAAQDHLTPLEGQKGLMLAGRAETALAAGESVDGLQSDFEDASARAAWTALADKLEPLKCDAKNCAADAYGRLWNSGAVDATALSRVGRIELRPGYAPRTTKGDQLKALGELVAVYPLVRDDDAEIVLQIASATAIDWVRLGCKSNEDSLQGLSALGDDARLRSVDRPSDTTMVWLATRGVESACGETSQLAQASEELAEGVGIASVPAEFLALHVEQAPNAGVAKVLATAAQFAVSHERADRCANWTVALASAHADAGHYELALGWIQQATRCDVPERTSIDLVSAYLNFQRTSTTSADFALETRERLRTVAHVDIPSDSCAGIGSLDYRIIPALPDAIRTLASRVELPAAKRGEDLSLVTASDRLANAREHLRDARARLDSREFAEAAASLQHARSAFESIGHEVGIARVRWLDKFLFADQTAAIAAKTAEPKVSAYLVGLAKKKAATFTELAATDTATRLALALLADDVATASGLAKQKVPDRPALCEPSPRRLRNVAIDSVDGKLQDIRGRDEGPEIELVEPSLE